MKKCEVCGKSEGRMVNSYKFKMTLCSRHYAQINTFGKVLERTRYDKNEIVEDGPVSYIVMRDMQQQEAARAIVDSEDVEMLSQYKWSYSCHNRYAITNINNTCTYLHRLIVGYTGDLDVDHINRNKLDCTKNNLRIVTHQKNTVNRSIHTNNKSGISGVHYNVPLQRWIMTIRINNKPCVKRFKTKEEAIKSRLLLEKEIYRDFAPQAHLFERYNIV